MLDNYVGWLQLIDDGGLSAVVQPQTKHVHLLLLQAQPSCQLVEEPHRPAFKYLTAATLTKAKGSKLRGAQLQRTTVLVMLHHL